MKAEQPPEAHLLHATPRHPPHSTPPPATHRSSDVRPSQVQMVTMTAKLPAPTRASALEGRHVATPLTAGAVSP